MAPGPNKMCAFLLLLLSVGLPAELAAHQGSGPAPTASGALSVGGLAWSPDGGWIAFVVVGADTAGQSTGEVWLADAEGALPARAVAGNAARLPAFSPDGRGLSYLARRADDAAAQLYLQPLNGGPARRLTDAPGGVEGYDWTPDGATIVFTAKTGDATGAGGAQLWAIGVADGAVRPLGAGPFHTSGPEVSPDGLWVAHERALIARDGTRYATDLWLIPISGGSARRLTTEVGRDRDARWSPDGRRIAYRSTPAGSGERLRLLVLDGRPPADVTDPEPPGPGPPVWTRDGRLIFVAGGAAGRLVSVPADPVLRGRGVHTLFEDTRPIGAIAIAPAGDRLAFVRLDAEGSPELYVVPIDGDAAAHRIVDLRSAPDRPPAAGGDRGAYDA